MSRYLLGRDSAHRGTFATPGHVTHEELRIACCFPDGDATTTFCRALADGDAGTDRPG